MTAPATQPLNKTDHATIAMVNGVPTCEVSLGPDQGKANWDVDTVLWSNGREGVAPIPIIKIYKDITDPSGIQAQSYDGSFGQAGGSVKLARGSHIIGVWTGGQVGDVCHLTVTGEQW